MKEIKLVENFSDCPGGRFAGDGEFSGEQFREELLRPALSDEGRVIVDLNGAFTIPPSFLDEAFGVIVEEIGVEAFRRKFEIRLDDDPAAEWELQDVLAARSGRRAAGAGEPQAA